LEKQPPAIVKFESNSLIEIISIINNLKNNKRIIVYYKIECLQLITQEIAPILAINQSLKEGRYPNIIKISEY
jgi:hypothetical protein